MTGNCNKHRVFVVDDDAQIAEICTLVLREAGFEVETFHDGMAALQRAMEYEPDVVLTDFSMPKMDGITLATCLEKHYPACRVVIISGQAVQLGEDDPQPSVHFAAETAHPLADPSVCAAGRRQLTRRP